MKQQIDNLIANLLLDESEVYLPKVGTLILRRQPAKLLSAKSLQLPYQGLCLTNEERGKSIVAFISHKASVSEERAEDIYAEWLEQSVRADKVTINGVCVIEKGSIKTDKTFEDMANPNGRGTKKMNPRSNYFIYIMSGLCIGFALGIAGYVMYSNNMFDNLFAKERIAPASEAFKELPSEPTAQPVDVATEESIATTEPTVAEPINEPVAESSVESIANSSILPMHKGSSYAVWGVYNELANAQDAKAWLAERFPEIEANVYQYDERYMVALCELPSRSECGRKVSAWKSQHNSFQSVWVYTRE